MKYFDKNYCCTIKVRDRNQIMEEFSWRKYIPYMVVLYMAPLELKNVIVNSFLRLHDWKATKAATIYGGAPKFAHSWYGEIYVSSTKAWCCTLMFKPNLALTISVKDLQSLQGGELTRDAGLFQRQRRCFGRNFMKRFSLLICTCLYSLILLYSFRSSAFGF